MLQMLQYYKAWSEVIFIVFDDLPGALASVE